MSSGRRGRKKSGMKLSVWALIICVIVISVSFYLINDMQDKIDNGEVQNVVNNSGNTVENDVSEPENVLNENQVPENVVENEISNEIENKIENTIKNTVIQNSGPAKPAVTDKKQKAIELVKKEWGEDASVNYVFEYINEKGEYVIAVKDRASATVKYYFRVDLETESVELD